VRVVLDTNVLVSGFLSPRRPPGRVVDLVTTGHLLLLHDDRILAEYREVLARPRFAIRPAEAAAVLDLIVHEGILCPAPPLSVPLPDPDDLPFLEVAVAGLRTRTSCVAGPGPAEPQRASPPGAAGALSRRRRFRIFPVGLLGMAPVISTRRGTL